MSEKKYLYHIALLSYFSLIAITVLLSSYYTVTLSFLSFVAIAQLILGIFIVVKRGYGVLSLPTLFIIVSFMFHLSHLVLLIIDSPVLDWYDLRGFTTPSIYIKALIFTMKVQASVLLGLLFVKLESGLNESPKIVKPRRMVIDRQIIFKIGIILILIGIVPRLYIDIKRFLLLLSGDYLSTYDLVLSGVVVVMAGMVDTGVIFLLIGKNGHPVFCKRLFVFSLIYLTLVMLTGHRANSMITILTLVFVYFDIIKQVNIKTMVLWGVLGYTFIFLISLVADVRMLGSLSIDTIVEYSLVLLKSSPILEIFGEFGTSLKSVIYSIPTFPALKNFSFGANYMKGLLLVIPNIGGFLAPIINEITYIFHFPNSIYMGGSYVGELYYVAGEYGVIFAIFIGLLLGHVSKNLHLSKNTNNWIKYAIYIVFFPNILWWCRDFFYSMVREIAWTIIIVVLVYQYLIKRFYHELSDDFYRIPEPKKE